MKQKYRQKGDFHGRNFDVVHGQIACDIEALLASDNPVALLAQAADIAVAEMLTAWETHKDSIELVPEGE